MLSVLGVFAFFPMVISGFVAYGLFREKDFPSAIKATMVCIICLVFVAAAPKAKTFTSDEECTRYSKWATTC